MTCPTCGAAAAGNFCSECGTTLAAGSCPRCQAALSPGARFCHRCGTPVAGRDRESARPWIVATAVITLAVGAILYGVLVKKPQGAAAPEMANTGASATAAPPGGAPPDISQMSPEERFIRLNDRVMAAVEQGDSATALRFLPMALAAYGQLPQVDADLRYHAALLHITSGELPPALALADSIMGAAPNHLFGWLIRAMAAEAQGDQAALAGARKAFLDHYEAELKQNRPEYTEHKAVLEEFRRQAGKP